MDGEIKKYILEQLSNGKKQPVLAKDNNYSFLNSSQNVINFLSIHCVSVKFFFIPKSCEHLLKDY